MSIHSFFNKVDSYIQLHTVYQVLNANLYFLMKLISNQQSAISNQQSAISNQQSAISNQQSAISNQQSAISNQQLYHSFG
ncbi:MAG: hypothetical protein FWD87_03750, partial [Spirochaetaceae bacterium]|nr:hypothetical protein [Spirochaetaceae bacterium]